MPAKKPKYLHGLLAGVTVAAMSLVLTACSNPLSSVEPFASGDVPYSAATMPCKTVPADESTAVTSEVMVIEAPTKSFVLFGNAIGEAEAGIRASIHTAGAKISTVIADGSPRLAHSYVVNFDNAGDSVDEEKEVTSGFDILYQSYFCTVINKTENKEAFSKAAGADYLQALAVAKGGFTHPSARHEIVVLGNGLQDVGQLDLTSAFPANASSAVSFARNLASAGGLPDLTGVKVSWYGLGQTAHVAQQALHPAAQAALVALWRALIEEAGGELVKVVTTIPYAEPVSTSIQTTTVSVPEAPCAFMLTSDDGFNFKPDSAEFLDADKARRGAENMTAEIVKSKCSGPLYVAGYAASGVDKKDFNDANQARLKSLSAARAVAFKSMLEKSGVTIKLVPVGAGKGPTDDWDAAGKFVESLGKQNRFVEVTQSKPEGD
ncbi:MAG: hypothetical protein RL672_696 [Actinomycetota bacterium]